MKLLTLLRDPLLHFSAIALGLFALHEFVAHDDPEAEARTIVIDRAALLNFIQYRSKAFDPETAEKQLAGFSDEELQYVIEDLIREEALAREARALGLDANDYVIKRRLVQKLDYIARGFAESAFEISEADVEAYFEENKDDFYIHPRITFTHVFYSLERHGVDGAMERAAETLQDLRNGGVRYAEAGQFGERFLYGLNFADRSEVLIASQFGVSLTETLFSGDVPVGQWSGPYQSEFGAHLVLLANLVPGRDPTLDQVRPQVTQQAARALSQRRAEEASQQIVDRYTVELAYPAETTN